MRDKASSNLDRFTKRARKALSLAQEEAQRLRHDHLGTEHLLLGLDREGYGIAAKALERLGVDLKQLREAVASIAPIGARNVKGDLGFTPEGKQAIELAVEAAQRLRHRFIGTEHLLLGVIRQREGSAAQVLRNLNVDLEQLGSAVAELVEEQGEAIEVEPTKNNVVMCRLNDEDLDALDVLIEAGVRTTRSGSATWLIQAGIKANQELFGAIRSKVEEIRLTRESARALAEQVLNGSQENRADQESS